jgi:hypothetical protein
LRHHFRPIFHPFSWFLQLIINILLAILPFLWRRWWT